MEISSFLLFLTEENPICTYRYEQQSSRSLFRPHSYQYSLHYRLTLLQSMRTLVTDLRGNPIPIADRRSIRRHQKTTLMRCVETQAWNDVVRRARSSHGQQELWQIDEQGNTALHLACKFDPPISVIRALGAAVSASNANGLTPLHVAASHRCNARTLRALVELRRASLRTPSRRERTPMHYACLSFRGLDFDAFEVLLDASLQQQQQQEQEEESSSHQQQEPDDANYDDICNDEVDNSAKRGVVLTWKDSTGSTPLGLLFRRYRERVKSAICRLNQQNQEEDATMLQNDLGQLWGKSRLIVAKLTEERLQREGSLLNNAEDDSSLAWAVEHHLLGECKFRIVHASVGLVGYGCPPELIRLAIAMHPQQVHEMDEEGNLVRRDHCVLQSSNPQDYGVVKSIQSHSSSPAIYSFLLSATTAHSYCCYSILFRFGGGK
jgi:hypothetical protein